MYKANTTRTISFLLGIVLIFSAKVQADSALILETVIDDLPASWAIKVSPESELYVTHRDGRLSRYSSSGEVHSTYPLNLDDLYFAGQGGLLDIAFHPKFNDNKWIYLSYSFGNNKQNGLKIVRIKLDRDDEENNKPTVIQTVFEQKDTRSTPVHYGGRMAFLSDSSLLVTTGEGFDYRENAQVKASQMGKVLRMSDVGEVLDNSPFANEPMHAYVYSYGHRNPQGLIVTSSGQVIAHEHGPAGGDEVNMISPGVNYGWPVITRGKDYMGSLITPFIKYQGMAQPEHDWTPSIAPSGMAFYEGNKFPSLSNKLLVTSLKFKQVHTLRLTDTGLSNEQIIFADGEYRLRDITVTDAGDIFVLTDGDSAKVLKVARTK